MPISTWIWIAVVLVLAWGLIVFWLACKRANRADWGAGWLNWLDGLNRLFCRRYHGFKHDVVPLPESGPAIVACNHISGLDPLLVFAACDRPLRFIIAKEEYERWWLKWLYRRLGLIPVDRSRRAEIAFYAARKALNRGEVIAMFPEGAIQRPGEPRGPMKRGVVMLAALADAPVVPVRVSGIEGAGMVVRAVFIRSEARMRSGPVIRVDGVRDDRALAVLRSFFKGGPRQEAGLDQA